MAGQARRGAAGLGPAGFGPARQARDTVNEAERARLDAMPRRTLTDRVRYWQARDAAEQAAEQGPVAPGRHRRLGKASLRVVWHGALRPGRHRQR